MGPDGYPQPLIDRESGAIDKAVAAHWRENFDLSHILRRDYARLRADLEGKIHIYCGDMDNFYLNNAVYLIEEVLQEVAAPGTYEVAYGDRDEHCWNGDPTQPNAITRLRYNTMYIPKMLDRMALASPPGADLSSWRY
jgi:hypothetical protein